MGWRRVPGGLTCLILFISTTRAAAAEEAPLPQAWEYAQAMRAVSRKTAAARPGVVLHVGDSITYANPYGGWARAGKGRTEADLAALKWMHAGAKDDSDGW